LELKEWGERFEVEGDKLGWRRGRTDGTEWEGANQSGWYSRQCALLGGLPKIGIQGLPR